MSTSFNPSPLPNLQSGYGSHLPPSFSTADDHAGMHPPHYASGMGPSSPYNASLPYIGAPNRPYMMPPTQPTDRFNKALSHGIRKALNPWAVTKDLFISGILTLPLWLFGLHIPIIALWTGGRMVYRAVKGALEGYSNPVSASIPKHNRMEHAAKKSWH